MRFVSRTLTPSALARFSSRVMCSLIDRFWAACSSSIMACLAAAADRFLSRACGFGTAPLFCGGIGYVWLWCKYSLIMRGVGWGGCICGCCCWCCCCWYAKSGEHEYLMSCRPRFKSAWYVFMLSTVNWWWWWCCGCGGGGGGGGSCGTAAPIDKWCPFCCNAAFGW